MNTPTETCPPAGSQIARRLEGADFHDAWAIDVADPSLSALRQFLKAVQATPRWVNTCMTLRNRVVQVFDIKDLGTLSQIGPTRPDADYRPGDRVGIFTLIENTPDEVLLGDRDKHLSAVISVHRTPAAKGLARVTVTTVVHTNNWLGKLYMLPVTPMHRIIVPAVLRAIGRQTPPITPAAA